MNDTTNTAACAAESANGETRIEIYTDGSALGNPGPGGCAFVALLLDEAGNVLDHAESKAPGRYITTNNRAELAAAINALAFVKERQASGLCWA